MTIDLSLHSVEQRLAAHTPSRSHTVLERRAAVSILLRYRGDDPDVLLMRRIERKGDPWSGQVSLPGGGADKTDGNIMATAIRETQEEVGLDLNTCARPLGRLDPIRPVPRGINLPLNITPFIFVQTQEATIVVGDEAQNTFWFPLGQAYAGELNGSHTFAMGPIKRDFPCWNYRGEVVWGLTHRILNNFFSVVSSG